MREALIHRYTLPHYDMTEVEILISVKSGIAHIETHATPEPFIVIEEWPISVRVVHFHDHTEIDLIRHAP